MSENIIWNVLAWLGWCVVGAVLFAETLKTEEDMIKIVLIMLSTFCFLFAGEQYYKAKVKQGGKAK